MDPNQDTAKTPEATAAPASTPTPAPVQVDSATTIAPVTPPAKASKIQELLHNKKLVVSAAIAVVVLGAATAGAMWWTSPETSFNNATTSTAFSKGGTVKGTLTVKPESGSDVSLDYNTQYAGLVTKTDLSFKTKMGAVKLDINGGIATTANKSVLFRINDIKDTVNSFAGDSSDAVDQYYGSLIDKIDGRWVEVTESDMKELTKDSDADTSCVLDKGTKLINDKKFLSEASDIYKKNPYLLLTEKKASEKIEGRDSNHVVVSYDTKKATDYSKSLGGLQSLKDLKTCFKDSDPFQDVATGESVNSPRIELWIDKWNHKVNKFIVTQQQDGTTTTLSGVMTYNDAQKVDVPAAQTKFSELKTEVEAIQEDFAAPAAADSFTLEEN